MSSKTKIPTLSVSYRFDVIELQNELGYLLPYLVSQVQNVEDNQENIITVIKISEVLPVVQGLTLTSNNGK